MSAQTGILVPCEKLQDDLKKYYNTCDTFSEPMPLYEFLMSGLNRAGTLQSVMSPGDSKLRQIRLTYTPRILHTSVSENVTHPTCVATTVRGNRWQDYILDPDVNIMIDEKITLQDLREICKPNSMIFAEKIAMMLDAMDRKAGYNVSEEAVVLAGNWGTDVPGVDASDNLEVSTLRDGTTDELAPFAMQDIKWGTEQSGYCDAYGIFTGSTLAKYADATKLGCCAQYGMDLGAIMAQWGTAVMYDRAVRAAFGGENFSLVVMNGALQVVTWNLYEMSPWNAFQTGNEVIMKIFTRRGLPVDFMAKYDCGVWHIVMTAAFKVFGMPTDMFNAGDIYEGVTFVNKVEVVNV